jgi:chromosome partitioning protein
MKGATHVTPAASMDHSPMVRQIALHTLTCKFREKGSDMARIIAIANQKGGVGKTTTAVNLSSGLAIAEKKVLLVDLDPQSNATSGCGFEMDRERPSVYEVMIGANTPDEAIIETEVPNLDLLPADIKLVGAEIELVGMEAREKMLRNAIREYALSKYEYIIIDSPPSLGLLTLNGLTCADTVLIPIQCEYYALEGLSQLLNTVRLVQKHLNQELTIEGGLLTMYDPRLNLSRQVAEEIRTYFEGRVFKSEINRNVRLSEAPSFGKPIMLYDITSKGAENYLALAEEILENDR